MPGVAQRPNDVSAPEVRRDSHGKGSALAAPAKAATESGGEMGGLQAIELRRLNEVARAKRDINELFRIPIHESEGEGVGPIGVRVEAIEEGRNEITCRPKRRQRKSRKLTFGGGRERRSDGPGRKNPQQRRASIPRLDEQRARQAELSCAAQAGTPVTPHRLPLRNKALISFLVEVGHSQPRM